MFFTRLPLPTLRRKVCSGSRFIGASRPHGHKSGDDVMINLLPLHTLRRKVGSGRRVKNMAPTTHLAADVGSGGPVQHM